MCFSKFDYVACFKRNLIGSFLLSSLMLLTDCETLFGTLCEFFSSGMHQYLPVPTTSISLHQGRSKKSAKFDFLTVVAGYFHSLCRLPSGFLLLKISAPGYLTDFVSHMWNTASCNNRFLLQLNFPTTMKTFLKNFRQRIN